MIEFKQIICPVDFSESSVRAFAHAAAITRWYHAQLTVLGTYGRRGFKRLLLGSVTEAIVREAPCPVLTVPPEAPAGGGRVADLGRDDDLVVCGRAHRVGLALFGSTTQQVLRGAMCPVLTVRGLRQT